MVSFPPKCPKNLWQNWNLDSALTLPFRNIQVMWLFYEEITTTLAPRYLGALKMTLVVYIIRICGFRGAIIEQSDIYSMMLIGKSEIQSHVTEFHRAKAIPQISSCNGHVMGRLIDMKNMKCLVLDNYGCASIAIARELKTLKHRRTEVDLLPGRHIQFLLFALRSRIFFRGNSCNCHRPCHVM
ncbi:hypothetical protein LOK49_LG14G00167 [Camellia lanceoleosa]|uniref:Uncharacterized protein n=1 Tax=Camellia lanceoleosa TaxID=1840588 RepID=A0ACC0FFA0_9ERIC|nr:hypothetical protein LOK49_LG14G00167 [Camellia lanceoleosa]